MEVIKFKSDGPVCTDRCPFGMKDSIGIIYVGSTRCVACRHFEARDLEEKTLVCNNKNNKNNKNYEQVCSND